MSYGRTIKNPWLLFLLFIALTFALYFPTIGRSFTSDDFLVLRRVALDRIIFIQGFFRPLSDISLYLNYIIGGFNPVGYYLFGLFLHCLNAFLLYNFCMRWKWTENGALQFRYSFLAAVLFLCYPFHNESIVWILGRASSMANTFGILALLILVSELPEKLKILLVCLCYFIGLTAYESIILLPLLIIVIIYGRNTAWHRYMNWTIAMGLTFGVHMILRKVVSGALAGSYGEGFFKQKGFYYFTNIFKTAGRLFLPPVQNSNEFLIACALLFVFLTVLIVLLVRQKINNSYFLKLITAIFITCVVPVLFGVSTKTSESDRFLHLPSFFLCACISFVLVNRMPGLRRLMITSAFVCAYFIIHLEKNNSNWIRASDITKNILKTVGENVNHNKTFVVNLPDEYNGAYIFRLGFKDALVIYGIDTSGVVVVNNLKREQMRWFSSIIYPAISPQGIYIPPRVHIGRLNEPIEILRRNDNSIYLNPGKTSTVLYWNTRELVRLQ